MIDRRCLLLQRGLPRIAWSGLTGACMGGFSQVLEIGASLACTLPIFLVVAATGLAAGSLPQATGQFVSYALGMGSVLSAVVLGAAFFQAAISRSVRRMVPYVHRLAASLLVGAGLFVSWYWLTTGGLLEGLVR